MSDHENSQPRPQAPDEPIAWMPGTGANGRRFNYRTHVTLSLERKTTRHYRLRFTIPVNVVEQLGLAAHQRMGVGFYQDGSGRVAFRPDPTNGYTLYLKEKEERRKKTGNLGVRLSVPVNHAPGVSVPPSVVIELPQIEVKEWGFVIGAIPAEYLTPPGGVTRR